MGDPSNNLLNKIMLSILIVLLFPVWIYQWVKEKITGRKPYE